MLALPLIHAVSLALNASSPSGGVVLGRSSDEALRSVAVAQQPERTPSARILTFPRSGPGKWTELLSRHSEQTASSGSRWPAMVAELSSGEEEEILERVNLTVNSARYRRDALNWRASDFWGTPEELFSKGGDCEDFAIAKYLLLRAIGIQPARMQLAIGKDHAFLIVLTEKGPVSLDNRHSKIRPLNRRDLRRVKFTVNEIAWSVWLG